MIEVHCYRFEMEDAPSIIKKGEGVQYYNVRFSINQLEKETKERFKEIEIDVWYTERNGDPICMVLPKGTPPENFPNYAMEYCALSWEHPNYPNMGKKYIIKDWEKSSWKEVE